MGVIDGTCFFNFYCDVLDCQLVNQKSTWKQNISGLRRLVCCLSWATLLANKYSLSLLRVSLDITAYPQVSRFQTLVAPFSFLSFLVIPNRMLEAPIVTCFNQHIFCCCRATGFSSSSCFVCNIIASSHLQMQFNLNINYQILLRTNIY